MVGDELLALGIALHGLRTLRDRWTAERTERTRRAAVSGLQPVAPRRPVHQTLHTQLGQFGVPRGWSCMDAVGLRTWRDLTQTAVIGGMTHTQIRPRPIIDVTLLGSWPEPDPRDFLRLATDFRQEMVDRYAKQHAPVRSGPGTVLVGGRPAIWVYFAGSSDGVPLLNAVTQVLVGNHIVGLQLIATATTFELVADDFWTVVATANWG